MEALLDALPLDFLEAIQKRRNLQKSLISFEALPIWPFCPGTPHYIVTIPRDTSSLQCFFCDNSGVYERIQVNLAEFAGGNHTSLTAGLEVGRMSVLENLLTIDEVRGGAMIEEDNEEGGLDMDDSTEVPGAQPAIKILIRWPLSSEKPPEIFSLPIPTGTSHYVISIPKEPYYLPGTVWLHHGDSQMYMLIKYLTDFTDSNVNHASFVAGVQVGRMSVLANPVNLVFMVEEERSWRLEKLRADDLKAERTYDTDDEYIYSEHGSYCGYSSCSNSDVDSVDEDENDSVPVLSSTPSGPDPIPLVKLPGMKPVWVQEPTGLTGDDSDSDTDSEYDYYGSDCDSEYCSARGSDFDDFSSSSSSKSDSRSGSTPIPAPSERMPSDDESEPVSTRSTSSELICRVKLPAVSRCIPEAKLSGMRDRSYSSNQAAPSDPWCHYRVKLPGKSAYHAWQCEQRAFHTESVHL